jgi:hypothetical protein
VKERGSEEMKVGHACLPGLRSGSGPRKWWSRCKRASC